ncbi:hypothetical protein [Dactylosporangium sp. NPDC005555]|uniref:hypothetical protein n=1 Tax=Dactylosporangium sp. NPDC005555 TaxID=3154889 RepID=UPI0033B276AE
MTTLEDRIGRWRITSMELWDTDAIDLVEPAFIEFNRNRTGRFGFIAVEGWMDCRETTRDGWPCIEFTWEGSDEGDSVSGRGWAALAEDGTLDGRIFFHLGDDSGFHAVRAEPEPGGERSRRRR